MTTLNELFGAAGSKPKLITAYTSGTGTYVPTVDMARCLVRLQASGGGGLAAANIAGGGGEFLEFWVRVPIAGSAYAVGALAAISANGNPTTFGTISAVPGSAGAGVVPGTGGAPGHTTGYSSATNATLLNPGALGGIAGGNGGSTGLAGCKVGYPLGNNTTYTTGLTPQRNAQGNGSGGDSFYGIGGTNGNPPAAGNYGAGGGGNAASIGGYIEILDYGA